jgi:hypothetical protein
MSGSFGNFAIHLLLGALLFEVNECPVVLGCSALRRSQLMALVFPANGTGGKTAGVTGSAV